MKSTLGEGFFFQGDCSLRYLQKKIQKNPEGETSRVMGQRLWEANHVLGLDFEGRGPMS